MLPAWGGRPIKTVSKRDVIELLDGIIDRGAPGKVRSVYAHLHRLFKWAVGREIIAVSPMDGLECPVTATRRDRVLSDDELVKVWHAADDGPFGHALKLLILTGARREEITQLRWAELAGDTISLPGERTKTGEPRLIPLSAPALALLSGLPRTGAFVFTADGTKPVNGWSRAKRRLDAATGINQPWVVHDIRRTVATGCQKLGVSLQTVEALLGIPAARAPASSASIKRTISPTRSAPRSSSGGRTSRASYAGDGHRLPKSQGLLTAASAAGRMGERRASSR